MADENSETIVVEEGKEEVKVEKTKQEFPIVDSPQVKKHSRWKASAEKAGIIKGVENNGEAPIEKQETPLNVQKVKVNPKLIDNIIPNSDATKPLTNTQKIKALNDLDYMADDIKNLTDAQIADIIETKVKKSEVKAEPVKKEAKIVNIDPNKDKLTALGYNDEEIGKLKDDEKTSIIKDGIKKPVVNTLATMSEDEQEMFGKPKPKEDKKDEKVVAEAKKEEGEKKVEAPAIDETIKVKADRLDAIEKNPIAKKFLEYLESGETDFNKFISTAGIKDVSKLSVEDMIRDKCVKEKFEGKDLDDAVTDEMDAYDNMTPLAKRSYEKQLRSEVESEQSEILSKFKVEAKPDPEKERYNKIVDKAKSDIKTTLNENVGKKLKGEVLQITESMANDPDFIATVEFFTARFGKNIKDGKIESFNVTPEIISMAVSALNRKEERNELRTFVETKAAEEFFRERIRPTDKSDGGGVAPLLINNLTPEQQQAAIRNHSKVRGRKRQA